MLNVACEETDLMEGCQLYCKEPIEMDRASFTIQKLWEAISSPGVGYIGAKMLKANAACPLNHLLNICNKTLDQCKALRCDWRKLSWPKYPRKVIRLFVTITKWYSFLQYHIRSSAECSWWGSRKELRQVEQIAEWKTPLASTSVSSIARRPLTG